MGIVVLALIIWIEYGLTSAANSDKPRGGYVMLRSLFFAGALSAALPFASFAQTSDDLKNDEKTPGDVLVYGMG